MKKLKLIYLILFIMSTSISGCSQNKPIKEDYVSRKNASDFIENNFEEIVSGKNYVVFSIAEKDFLVIIENKDAYQEYFAKYNDGKISSKKSSTISKDNEVYSKMFDFESYRTDYITFNTDYFKSGYENASGNITYFVLKDKLGKSYGEARLSVIVKPNPIDAEVYLNLVNRVLHYVNLE